MRAVLLLTFVLCLTPASAVAQAREGGKTPTFLEIIPREQMTCGKRGWTFPVLYGGHIPLSACILKFRNNGVIQPFGRL